MDIVNRLLIELRKGAGFNVSQAARRIGITRAHLYKIENGVVDPSLSLVFRILHEYQILPEKLTVVDLWKLFRYSFRKFSSSLLADWKSKNGCEPIKTTPPDQVTGETIPTYFENNEELEDLDDYEPP